MSSTHQRLAGVLAAVLVATLSLSMSAMAGTDRPGSPAEPAQGARFGSLPATHGPSWAEHPELLIGSEEFQALQRPGPVAIDERPNIVLITTDDQTMTELRWMPKTRALIGEVGVTFEGSISPHPLCCPARAQIMTGQYGHNNNVISNGGTYDGFGALDESNTLPVWLRRAGYQTVFLGKYLNGYGYPDPRPVPPGWEHWYGAVRGIYDFSNATLNENGDLVQYRDVYQTDLFAGLTEALIPRLVEAEEPFFIWQSHVAPHTQCPRALDDVEANCWAPPTPAPAYNRLFDDVRPPQRSHPAYDEKNVRDKPEQIRSRPRLDSARETYLTELFQRRIESLASVDDAVARSLAALDEAGVLDETLVIFTSDNGFLLGQHRLHGKDIGYEPALRVPLLMRGPGVPAGRRLEETVTTIDLAPTILAAAHAWPGLVVDGRDLMPIVRREAPGWETVLIQGGRQHPAVRHKWKYRGVRTQRWTYLHSVRHDEVELYDRLNDPSQLRSVAGRPRYAAVEDDLARRLRVLGNCAGFECRRTFGPVPVPRP